MEYRITNSEVSPQCEDTEDFSGLLVHIRPPVPYLNPDAVERYVRRGDLEPLNDPTDRHDPLNEVNDVILLGSTPEQTTIYASIRKYPNQETYPDERIIRQVTRDVAKILEFMGAQAVVE